MKILIACEYSGITRRAFARRGHQVWSCDLIPSSDESPMHIIGDVTPLLRRKWDLVISHPPCTYLTVSANGAFKGPNGWTKNGTKRGPWRWAEVDKAVEFVELFMKLQCPYAIENPVGLLSSRIRKPDQTFQPWEFGHGEVKRTCLWLHKLPPLIPTNIVSGRVTRVHSMPPGPNRSKDRSLSYEGIAEAMADQWSRFLC